MNELINEIIQGDCLEVMKRIPNDYVDLTVTSPPYDNLRTYNEFDWDFEGIAEDLYRITKDGGVIVWVVGDATVNGSETGTSFRQALHFKEIGFRLHDTMIYKKSKIVPMDPNCNRYYQGFEYMFVLSKGKPNVCNYIKVPSKHAGKNAIAVNRNKDGSMRKDRIIKQKGHVVGNFKIKSNIWEYANKSVKGHPAPFPEKLAEDHILSWSNPGDIILDPFVGSGTTAKMAVLNDRRYIGVDVSEEYVEIARRRVDEALAIKNEKETDNI